jgi:hypothetical protein
MEDDLGLSERNLDNPEWRTTSASWVAPIVFSRFLFFVFIVSVVFSGGYVRYVICNSRIVFPGNLVCLRRACRVPCACRVWRRGKGSFSAAWRRGDSFTERPKRLAERSEAAFTSFVGATPGCAAACLRVLRVPRVLRVCV